MYRKHLYKDATLQDLPAAGPMFVINATSVQTGSLWRFSRAYMGDYRVGRELNPKVPLAVAVAAPSAFPPVLSPLELKVDPSKMVKEEGHDLHEKPYTSRVVLSDGGRLRQPGPGDDLEALRHDPRQRRRRWHGARAGAQGGLGAALLPGAELDRQPSPQPAQAPAHRLLHRRPDLANYELADALPAPFEPTLALANTPTRLKRMDDRLQERLINWGYAVADAALRKHVDPGLPKGSWPYPGSEV